MDPIKLLKKLTKRELEVLKLYIQALEYKEIGELLNIEENTVKTHVNNIYTKLNLKHMTPKSRPIAIREDFAPLIARLEDDELAEEEEIEVLEPPTAADERMFDDDRQAIRALQVVEPISIEADQPPRRSRLGGCLRLVLALALVAGVGAAAAFGWQTVSGFSDLYAQFVGDSSSPTPSQVSNPTNASAQSAAADPISSTPSPTLTKTPTATRTQTPTPTKTNTPRPTPTLDFGEVYEIGEWHREGDVWYRLFNYSIDDDTTPTIEFAIQVRNDSNQDVRFGWAPYENTWITDNTGRRYDAFYKNSEQNSVVPAHSTELVLLGSGDYTSIFDADFVYDSNITEIYYTLDGFSRIDRATWVIYIDH
jgi:hypothetical protein